ncbi:MAG: type II secretion system protein [Deltaproteobacteria bacterium]|nr:type II secretion system protein [Deltaproteobacteria bacterium]
MTDRGPTYQIAQRLRARAGYTLIELLVAVAIFGVLAAAGLPHVDTRRQNIQTATKSVIGDYRWARTRAITSGVHFAIKWTNSTSYQVLRMKETAPGVWAQDVVVKTVSLPPDVSAYWTSPATQEFNTRGMMISTTYAIWQMLYDTRFGGYHLFSVWPSGQVYEES